MGWCQRLCLVLEHQTRTASAIYEPHAAESSPIGYPWRTTLLETMLFKAVSIASLTGPSMTSKMIPWNRFTITHVIWREATHDSIWIHFQRCSKKTRTSMNSTLSRDSRPQAGSRTETSRQSQRIWRSRFQSLGYPQHIGPLSTCHPG